MNDTWYDMGLDADMDWMYSYKEKEKKRKMKNTEVAGITQQQLVEVAEKLNKWLDNISNEYQIDKIDLQSVIKQFLIG